ncbi:MAG: methyltransferase domain-containing protein [Candidatus Helarchaeota archaeon]
MSKKKELADRPDFEVYAKGMNITIRMKWRDINEFIIPGKIVDAGCGTGELIKLIAKKYPNSQVIGLDISDYFVQLALNNTNEFKKVEILQCDIRTKQFESESISTKIFSSVMHELASYNSHNKETPKKAIKQAYKELKPGGRIIIRDGISPGKYSVYMWLNNKNGINELDHKKNKKTNFEKLSTEARFIRFCLQFKGRQWEYKAEIIKGKKLYRMDAYFANEFMSKKEYVENWDVEILEEFGIFTQKEYQNLLQEAGFKIIQSRTYINPWILDNWYKNKLKIYTIKQENLVEIDYFPTNIVIVGEKFV